MRVLFISASNINISTKDTVELVNEMNKWSLRNEVHYISCNKLFCSELIGELNEKIKINFPTNSYGLFVEKLDTPNYVDHSVEYVKQNNIDSVLCQGSEVVEQFAREHGRLFATKVIVL